MLDQAPITFERYVCTGLIHSYRFYREQRDKFCKFDEVKRSWSRDFTTSKYNTLYQAIDVCWRMHVEDLNNYQDYGLPKEQIVAKLVDEANTGGVPDTVVKELLDEMDSDFYKLEITTQFLAMIRGEALQYWLDLRLTSQTIDQLYLRKQGGFLQAKDLSSVVQQLNNKVTNLENSNAVNMGDVLLQKIDYKHCFPTSIKKLNAALGGGLRRHESTMIAGSNASGKTVLAMQLAYEAASAGLKVVVFTTEQRPDELSYRCLSNGANVKFSEFVERKDVDLTNMGEFTVDSVPPWMWTDPIVGPELHKVHAVLSTNVYCVDWSQGKGQSIPGQFDQEIEALKAQGWDPEIIIFDWIGGGLERGMTNRDWTRHFYQEAADHIINHSKRTGRHVVIMAQLDKTKSINKKAPTMSMMSECKTMSNNVTNWIGISSMTTQGSDESRQNLATKQFFNVEKARKGPGGRIPVSPQFQYQKWTDWERERLQ